MYASHVKLNHHPSISRKSRVGHHRTSGSGQSSVKGKSVAMYRSAHKGNGTRRN